MSLNEKFQSATVELAGAGSIKQRLIGAYVHHLATVKEEQIPKEVREDFCALTRAMCSVRPLPGEDAVRATVRKMSDGEANRYAVQIVNMSYAMARTHRPVQANVGDSTIVQLYAAQN